MTAKRIFVALILQGTILVAGSAIQAAAASNDQAQIRQLALSIWDRPDRRLIVTPIVVVDAYAVADWTQDAMGGRALLRKRSGRWAIIFCSGDALKKRETLENAGIPRPVATLLAKRLAQAEVAVNPRRVAQFSRFHGLVRMEGAGSHSSSSASPH